LTANLQLRPVPQPSREPRGAARGPRLEPGLRASACAVERVPGGAPIVGSSALHLPPAVFSTARRACDPTSGVLVASRGGSSIAAASPSPRSARSGSAAVSSKTTAFAVPGRLPSTSAPSPGRAGACAPARGITESPPPVSLLACSWLSPPRPGFRRLFTRRALPREQGAGRLDPGPFGPGPSAARRLLQPTRPASTTTVSPDPRLRRARAGPACARALRSPSPPGVAAVGSIERQSRSPAGRPFPAPSAGSTIDAGHEAEAPRLGADGDQPRFHGPGAGRAGARSSGVRRAAFAGGGSLPSALAGLRERELPQPDPLGHLSSRDRDHAGWRVRPGQRRPRRAGAADDPTTRAPTPAKGRSSRALDDPLARGRPRGSPVSRLATSHGHHRTRRVACADTSGARAASPVLPRRSPKSAAPEVPSIDDPAPPPAWPKPRR